jgi:hypothetical protein
MDNANNPEALAAIPLPTAQERKRREVMLARVISLSQTIYMTTEF